MKGFFRWFKNSAKMKRWLLIILIGIILACIGISKIMVAKTISFAGVGKVIVLFVVYNLISLRKWIFKKKENK